ncbi:MAG TPA: SMP-30/gluconolactonase/LRE family protein [Bacteroidia bacterium]|nr:SMP-30/gluconolactonase/LRE family protein [Bacteroidia bacterium]
MKKNTYLVSSLFALAVTLPFTNATAQTYDIKTIAGNGTAGFAGDNGNATAAELNNPSGVCADASGNIYVADVSNNRIRMITSSGLITTIVGNGTAGFAGDNGAATAAELNGPSGVCFDLSGNLYIADEGNYRIRKVTTAGIITTVAGNGTKGYAGDNAAATAAKLNNPSGVAALDVAGNLYIADQDNNRVRMVSAGGTITTVAGNGSYGYSGDNAAATAAELAVPMGVALDASGNLYIADNSNSRIRKVSTGGTITTVAGNGTAGMAGDNGAATAAKLNYPEGVAVDKSGNIYIADFSNSRVRMVNTAGTISTIAGDGSFGFTGDNGPAANAELNYPAAVTADLNGNIYLADLDNERVRELTIVSGINEVSLANSSVKISPNPNNGAFIVSLQQVNSMAKIEVYNIIGEEVYQATVNPNTTQVNMGSAVAGIYLYRVLTLNGALAGSGKFIVH